MGVTAAIAVGGAYIQSENQKAMAKYQAAVGNANARLADLQADRVLDKGARDAANYGKKVNQIVGAQRAAFAAQGIDITSGSAADVVADTQETGAQDMMTIKNNAVLEAWGIRSQAIDLRSKAQMGLLAADNSFKNSLVTGGLQAYRASGGAGSFGGGGGTKASTGTSVSVPSGAKPSGTGYLGGSYEF